MNKRKWVLKVYIEDHPGREDVHLNAGEVRHEVLAHLGLNYSVTLPLLIVDGLSITDYDLQEDGGQ